MTDMQWEDPPSGGRQQQSPVAPLFEKLKSDPFRWAKIPNEYFSASAAYQVASRVRRGVFVDARPGEFEAVARRLPGTDRPKWGLWVRYVGEAAL